MIEASDEPAVATTANPGGVHLPRKCGACGAPDAARRCHRCETCYCDDACAAANAPTHACMPDDRRAHELFVRKTHFRRVTLTDDGMALMALPGPVPPPVPHYMHDVTVDPWAHRALASLDTDAARRAHWRYVLRHVDYFRMCLAPERGGATREQHEALSAAYQAAGVLPPGYVAVPTGGAPPAAATEQPKPVRARLRRKLAAKRKSDGSSVKR